MGVELAAPFNNSDLDNLFRALIDPNGVANESLLMEIRDRLDEFFIPTGNRQIASFNMTDIETFQAALAEWYAAAGNADFVIISEKWVVDQNGTDVYIIIYA